MRREERRRLENEVKIILPERESDAGAGEKGERELGANFDGYCVNQLRPTLSACSDQKRGSRSSSISRHNRRDRALLVIVRHTRRGGERETDRQTQEGGEG